MRRLRIGTRLALAFSLIILLTFLGSVLGLWQFNRMQAQVERLNQINNEAIAILEVNNTFLRLQRELQQLTEIRDVDRFSTQARQLRDGWQQALDEAIAILTNSAIPDQQIRYRAQVEQLEDISNLSTQIDLMIELAEAGDWPAVRERLENQVQQIGQITQNLVGDINDIVESERRRSLENADQVQQQAFGTILLTGLLILAMAALSGYYVTRSISRPLAQLTQSARSLANRTFDHQVEVSGDDELAILGHVFNDAASQLAELYTGLEARVKERTEELDRRATQLETSLGVGHHISSILDLDTLLAQVTALIKERYGYYFVGVFLIDEAREYMVARAGTGEAGQQLRDEGFRLKVGQAGLIGWVAHYRRPARVDDVSQDERYIRLDIIPDTRSELALPLMVGKNLVGVLDIQSDKVGAFDLDDVPVLQSLADQVSVAIENAVLYQAEQSRRRLTEALYEAGRIISGTLDPDEVVRLIMEHLSTIVPHDRTALLLDEEGELRIAAARGFPASVSLDDIKIFINDSDIFRHLSQTQAPLAIPDVARRGDWQHVEGVATARAWLGVPLIRLDRVIGMLSLTRITLDSFSPDEITLASTFAGHVAIALENARLYHEITRVSQHLEEAVAERTEALEQSRNDLQMAFAQLEHLDQTKTDFIRICAHELRTPLTVLQGYSQMLLNDGTIKDSEYLLDLISTIHSGAGRLHEIVNSMLDMTKIDTRALELYPEPVSAASLLQMVGQKFNNSLTERNITLTIDDMTGLPPVEADPEALHKVFYHLIANAIKYTPDGGQITIAGQRVRGNGQGEMGTDGIELLISDTGIGIDAKFHDLIFTKFYQTGQLALHSTGQTKFKGAGPGLGLAIAKGIVEAHQGKIWVESEGHDEETYPGSTFYIFLPLRQAEGVASMQSYPSGQKWRANE